MSSDKKYRVKIKKHMDRQQRVLMDSVADMSDIRSRLEEAGVDTESIVNLFSQAYAVVGMRYDIDPQELLRMLTFNGLGLGIMNDNPDMTPDELAHAVEREVNGEPPLNRSTPDPDMPLFLAPGVGEA